jgi:hypothetical protein
MKKPKRQGDRHEMLRNLDGTIVPPKYKKPIKDRSAPPESELQESVNKLLKKMGLYQFRLSAQLLSGHGDRSVGGWPDSPIIIKLAPGVSLIFPLELKKRGEVMRPNQLEMQDRIGTICADNLDDAIKYVYWAVSFAEQMKKALEDKIKHYKEVNK